MTKASMFYGDIINNVPQNFACIEVKHPKGTSRSGASTWIVGVAIADVMFVSEYSF